MKPSNNQTSWTTEAIEAAQRRYQEELMLKLQPIESHTLLHQKNGWQPGFEKVYARLSELDDIFTLPQKPNTNIVKH